MFKRFLPGLLVLVCFLLDSTVIAEFLSSVFIVPLTVVAVFSIGMILGRMRGLLYGTMGGLLMDITTGTLGMMTYFLMFMGFMIGLIVYVPNERLLPSRRKRQRRLLWRSTWVFALYTAGELALFVIQYFSTATFAFMYLLLILARALICTLLCALAHPLMTRLLTERGVKTRTQEVKRF